MTTFPRMKATKNPLLDQFDAVLERGCIHCLKGEEAGVLEGHVISVYDCTRSKDTYS